jgi:murein DD-endopeptidase MepM/ murein hydrolase activator NlpD
MSRRALVIFIVLTALLALPLFARAETTEPRVIGAQRVDRLHLVFPQDPQLTWFLDTFGASRGGGHVHIGNDLHAPKGSPVYAIAPGMVRRMAISGRAGAYLVIDHGADWTSWYMHLDNDDPGTDNGRGGFETAFAAGISEGTFVDAGQLIGFVGDSGNAENTVPHTHFELHRNGKAIDPYRLLVQAQERALLSIEAERMADVATRIV